MGIEHPEHSGNGLAEIHVAQILGMPVLDEAVLSPDLEQGRAYAFRIASELHRGGIGEELALARYGSLDHAPR